MAIKKTTSAKKSDPPSKKKVGPPTAPTSMYKKWNPDRMLAGKDFGKIGSKGAYYYEEGGRGMGGIRRSEDFPSLDPKKTQGQLERELEFNRMLTTPRRQLVTASEYKRYADAKKQSAARTQAARTKAAIAAKAKKK